MRITKSIITEPSGAYQKSYLHPIIRVYNMRVIPVIDIMGGVVVHAKGGQRDGYQAVKSHLCETSNPIDVALALESKFGFRELYIADLDSIIGYGENMDILKRIHELSNMKIMVDSGANDIQKVRDLLQAGVEKVVVGTETLENLMMIKRILGFVGEKRITVSLDLKKGKILSKNKEIARMSPKILAKRLELMGVMELIILDLFRIGSESGVDIELARRLVDSIDIPIIMGGGVRDIGDIIALRGLGISGVLVSTALHTAMIRKEDLLGL
jgi:phosphoribosylformimino-5-aminoimidazole carboxamide ribotide isomerase